MMPSVSVIIPTYNRRPLVREAVESVLAQSYRGFELIVVDDGSEDGTVRELSACGPGITVIPQARRGAASARNLGVRSSRGKYLAFLDSDDLWKPRKLEIQAAFLDSHPELEICQTEEVWLRNGRRVNPRKRHRKPSGDIFRPSLELCLVSPSAVMMTRGLFELLGGFDESFPVCEDYDLWLRVSRDYPVPLIPDPLTIKRGGHPDQLSRSTWGMDRFRVRALEKLLRSGVAGEKRSWVIEAMAGKIAVLAGGARRRGRESEALEYERLAAEFTRERDHVGPTDSGLR